MAEIDDIVRLKKENMALVCALVSQQKAALDLLDALAKFGENSKEVGQYLQTARMRILKETGDGSDNP